MMASGLVIHKHIPAPELVASLRAVCHRLTGVTKTNEVGRDI